jgi:hypothetical protein
MHLEAPEGIIFSGPIMIAILVAHDAIILNISGPVCPNSIA